MKPEPQPVREIVFTGTAQEVLGNKKLREDYLAV